LETIPAQIKERGKMPQNLIMEMGEGSQKRGLWEGVIQFKPGKKVLKQDMGRNPHPRWGLYTI